MMNRLFVCFAVVASVFAVLAAPADAQGLAAGRVFVGGTGGVTFGSIDTGGFGGIRAGVRVGPGVHIFGEAGGISDVTPSSVRDDLDGLLADLSTELGVSTSLSLKAPATYGFGGVRWTGRNRMAPFVEFGGGAADITLDFDNVTIGGIDVTSTFKQFVDEEGLDLETTAGMLVFGGGLNAGVSRLVSIDAGFRYARIFTEDPAINVASAYAAVVFGW